MRPLLLLLLCLTLLACASGSLAGDREDLVQVVRSFNLDLRWGRKDALPHQVVPEARERIKRQVAALGEDVELLDYEIQEVTLGPRPGQALARVEVSWNDRRQGLLMRTQALQRWELRQHRWLLLRQERQGGSPMGLFEEAAPSGAAGSSPAPPPAAPPAPRP